MEQGEPVKITEEGIDQFLEEEKITNDYYKYILGKYLRDKGEFSEESVRDFVSDYDKKSSQNTVLSTLRSLAKWKKEKIPPLGEDNQMRRWNLERITGIKGGKVIKKVEEKGLTIEELKEVLGKCENAFRFATVWLLHYFGCRPGELAGVESDMVDFGEGMVTFETEKTKVEREAFFDEFTGRQLKTFLDVGEVQYPDVYKMCKGVGIIPKSGRQSFRTHQPERIDWTPPIRVHELIDLWCGHTVSGMDFVYSNVRPHLKRIKEVHYMRPLEEEVA